jgi:hypothetical protein
MTMTRKSLVVRSVRSIGARRFDRRSVKGVRAATPTAADQDRPPRRRSGNLDTTVADPPGDE